MQKSMSISGKRHALGIQEALEDQLVLQGIEIGDAERVGNQRPCGRTAARTHRDVALAGVANEIPDDQEVSGKLHLLNDGQFPRQTLLIFGQAMLQPPLRLERPQCFQPPREAFAATHARNNCPA